MKDVTDELRNQKLLNYNGKDPVLKFARDLEKLTKYWQLDNVQDLYNNYKQLTITQEKPKFYKKYLKSDEGEEKRSLFKRIKEFFSFGGLEKAYAELEEAYANLIEPEYIFSFTHPAESLDRINFNHCFLDNVSVVNSARASLKYKVMFFDISDETTKGNPIPASYIYQCDEIIMEEGILEFLSSPPSTKFDIKFIPLTETYISFIDNKITPRRKTLLIEDISSLGGGKRKRVNQPVPKDVKDVPKEEIKKLILVK